jgi:hypothetical protein
MKKTQQLVYTIILVYKFIVLYVTHKFHAHAIACIHAFI